MKVVLHRVVDYQKYTQYQDGWMDVVDTRYLYMNNKFVYMLNLMVGDLLLCPVL